MTAFVTGLEELQVSINKLKQFKKAFSDEALKRVKAYSPVDTGLLADSWKVKISGNEMIFTNEAQNSQGQYYAQYVEFGTYKMSGAFMVTRTLAEAPQILRIAKQNAGL
jgi:hypothetical protein